MIFSTVTESVGRTPLSKSNASTPGRRVFVVESRNPVGVKDGWASPVEDAELRCPQARDTLSS
jgi:hypothetical protein